MSLLKIREAHGYVHPVETRIPFRFGIAEMRQMPHLFLQISLEMNGKHMIGIAADHLLPKWFTKNPLTSYHDDIREMQEVVAVVCQIAKNATAEPTPFQLWWKIYHEQQRQAKMLGWPPLLASFGASLIERALIDAFCRLEQKPFSVSLRENSLGINLGEIYPALSGLAPEEFLPSVPTNHTVARHTVGLSDPLTDTDLQNGQWPEDGLPVSLEACIRYYGLTQFKIKIAADTGKNIERLVAIVAVLDRVAPDNYLCTLDGNESYRSMAEFRGFWDRLLQTRELTQWLDHLSFVEQPLHRDVALQEDVQEAFLDCACKPRMIIDESDATVDSLPLALAKGYEGTTHKNCKGVFKSVANIALLKLRARSGTTTLFSGEDLTNIGPVALLQDLCVAQNLGLANLERNGHHYFRGLSNFPRTLWKPVLEGHPELYQELSDGCPSIRIEKGILSSPSVHQQGLGTSFDMDLELFTPLEKWRVESLDFAIK